MNNPITDAITNDRELRKALHDLPAYIRPGRDLWPGIASRLASAGGRRQAGKRPAWRHQAIAASAAIAFAAGLLFGQQMGRSERPLDETSAMVLAMQATAQASEREYQAAFREFIAVGAARTLLETQAVENIENSWADLQQAESALLAALRDYPENTYLNQKLLDLRAQQLGFMQQLAMLDQFSRRKI